MISPVLNTSYRKSALSFAQNVGTTDKNSSSKGTKPENVLLGGAGVVTLAIVGKLLYGAKGKKVPSSIDLPNIQNENIDYKRIIKGTEFHKELKRQIQALTKLVKDTFAEKKESNLVSEYYGLFRKRAKELANDLDFKEMRSAKKDYKKLLDAYNKDSENLTPELFHKMLVTEIKPASWNKAFVDDLTLAMLEPAVSFEKKYGMSVPNAINFTRMYSSMEPAEMRRQYRRFVQEKSQNLSLNLVEEFNNIMYRRALKKTLEETRVSGDVMKLRQLNQDLNLISKI